MHLDSGSPRSPFIGLTPLIDVVFILLVFFMLATRFGQFYDLPVNVQPGAESDAEERQSWLVVKVEDSGQLTVNGTPFTPEAIADRLDDGEKNKVWLTVSPGASLQQALTAMDAVKGAGVAEIQLELLP